MRDRGLPCSPASWLAAGHRLLIGGREVFVRVVGQGPPVLVLHGFPTSSYDWSRVAPLLAERYQLILFDYPGYGFSEKRPGARFSLHAFADAAQAVATHFGLDRCFVLAHDIGASITLELLDRGRPMIDRLVILNSSIGCLRSHSRLIRLQRRLMFHHTLGPLIGRLGLITKAVFRSSFEPLWARRLSPVELTAFWSLVRFNVGERIYHELLWYIPEREAHERRWLEALRRHQAPLTIVWGLADPMANSGGR